MKTGDERIHRDAREAIRWLDEITSNDNILATGQVQLQGVDEEYNTWAEVEKFLLPETLLSEENIELEENELSEGSENTLSLPDEFDKYSMSSSQSLEQAIKTPSTPRSAYSSASPGLLNVSPFKAASPTRSAEPEVRTARNSLDIEQQKKPAKGSIVENHHTLFQYILWRIHQESNTNAAMESFVLLTNDPSKQALAQRFGIRVKRLEQLRDAVGREERDYKNRLALFQKETGADITPLPKNSPAKNASTKPAPAVPSQEANADEDEDVVLFRRAPRGPQAANNQRVFDPNDFARVPPAANGRGGRGGAPPRGPRGGRYVPPSAGRGAPRDEPVNLDKPIDPDSFARPRPAARTFRGGRRALWEPT